MPKNRKTRAQKQSQSVRRTLPQAKTISLSSSLISPVSKNSNPILSIPETYAYVLPDLRKTVFLTTVLIVGELILYYIVQSFKIF